MTSVTRETNTLTCTTIGGPPTVVVWRHNCRVVTGGTQIQTVVDTSTAQYQTILTLASVENGVYSCTVENIRGRASMTLTIGG